MLDSCAMSIHVCQVCAGLGCLLLALPGTSWTLSSPCSALKHACVFQNFTLCLMGGIEADDGVQHLQNCV